VGLEQSVDNFLLINSISSEATLTGTRGKDRNFHVVGGGPKKFFSLKIIYHPINLPR